MYYCYFISTFIKILTIVRVTTESQCFPNDVSRKLLPEVKDYLLIEKCNMCFMEV